MPAVSLLAFPLFSDSVFIKHLGFWTLSNRGFPTHFPHRNPSVFYSQVQMPLLPGSPLPFSLHILVRGQKKKKQYIYCLVCFLEYCGIPFLTSMEDTLVFRKI